MPLKSINCFIVLMVFLCHLVIIVVCYLDLRIYPYFPVLRPQIDSLLPCNTHTYKKGCAMPSVHKIDSEPLLPAILASYQLHILLLQPFLRLSRIGLLKVCRMLAPAKQLSNRIVFRFFFLKRFQYKDWITYILSGCCQNLTSTKFKLNLTMNVQIIYS